MVMAFFESSALFSFLVAGNEAAAAAAAEDDDDDDDEEDDGAFRLGSGFDAGDWTEGGAVIVNANFWEGLEVVFSALAVVEAATVLLLPTDGFAFESGFRNALFLT